MQRIHSLRFRVAFVFALFGAVLSILLAAGIYLTVRELADKLMDETLSAELDDSAIRYASNPSFVPPNTISIKGYILSGAELSHYHPPAEVIDLSPGSHNVAIDGVKYRALVADRNGARYFMLFDTEKEDQREQQYYRYLLVFAVFMTIASAAIGFWLALRILTPVARLAKQVGQAEPSDVDLSLSKLTRNDEVGELARAFDRYLHRLQEFIQRENYFTSDVSHELRTPLAIILGTVEVLEQDEALSPKQRERVARIRRAAQDMIELTAGLLWMAREHLSEVDEQTCHAAEVVRACVEKHRHLVLDRPIRIEVEVIGEPELVVERPLLEIVIGNLIRNALFHSNSGVIRVRLEAQRLIVQDSGVGMRPEELASALERHYKGASSAGSGLGLSLVKRICDRYGWRISLDSREGHGTTATIDFSTAK